MIKRIQHFLSKNSTADIIAFLGFLGYSLLSFFFAHTIRPILDEGLYTYKGWLFVTGRYVPYQDYGPWMNQMPLSFLIPGTAQVLFGPGLRTGRYFAVFLSLVMLVGAYFTARRLSRRWTATAVVLAFALNFLNIETYSVAISQGLVACILSWILFFSLGYDRPLWQILVAVFLAAVLALIRLNMLPVFIFLVLYIWWENGWSKARWAILVAILSFAGLHALFWPQILQNWVLWIPDKLKAILPLPALAAASSDVIVSEPDAVAASSISSARLDIVFLTLRSHFLPIAGAITTWLLWPFRTQWKKQTYYRMAVFLSVSFVVMLFAHAWVTLGKTYCVSCLPIYTAFFQILGIFLVVVSWKFWKKEVPFINQILTVLFIVIVCAGIAYSLKGTLDVRPIGTIQAVLVSALKIQHPIDMKEQILHFISSTFRIRSEKDAVSLSKQLGLAYYGALAGLLFLLLMGMIWYIQRRFSKTTVSFSRIALPSFLLVGFLLLPSRIMSNDNAFQCRKDQISNFEKLGEEISHKIPDGSQIYWLGYSPSLLLYLPQVNIFPPQLNGYNSFRTLSDSDELYRIGMWNNELAERWASDATYMIVTQLTYESADPIIRKYVKSGIYSEIPLDTNSFYTCDETNQLIIRLFERKE